jgi:signal transduction histidine kinase
MHFDETDLSTIAQESVSELREEANRAGSEVSVRVNDRVNGMWDRTRIAQVCTNLLTNAIKYGAGKPIELRIWANGRAAYLSVEDHGIGIPPDQQKRIFGRFERAVSHRHYGGLGLGLYICRQIVEAHGGTIELTSTDGTGTIFTVALPKARPVAAS